MRLVAIRSPKTLSTRPPTRSTPGLDKPSAGLHHPTSSPKRCNDHLKSQAAGTVHDALSREVALDDQYWTDSASSYTSMRGAAVTPAPIRHRTRGQPPVGLESSRTESTESSTPSSPNTSCVLTADTNHRRTSAKLDAVTDHVQPRGNVSRSSSVRTRALNHPMPNMSGSTHRSLIYSRFHNGWSI